MSGTVAALPVRPGLQVAAGDVLAVIEAMKMEHRIVAQFAGTVRAIAYAVGDTVKAGDLIVDVDPSN
jgi:biotin carboxyl carrier protein